MSDTTTRGIRVQVETFYDEERSSPQESYYFFSYHVRISNVGTETAQLVSREWFITDGNGDTQRVQGPGVVGEKPVLAPGEEFEYSSFCPSPRRWAPCRAPTAWCSRTATVSRRRSRPSRWRFPTP